MTHKLKRTYRLKSLPCEEDLSRFAIPYTPEKFTRDEKSWLKPFFTNIDKPVYAVKNLPEEVIGALSSRYSRSTQSLRRMFLNEYLGTVVFPEKQPAWETLSKKEKKTSFALREKFLNYISFLNKEGGVDEVVNVQRGRAFFDRWLAEYGDDSIAEMGGVHLCVEGLSNIAVKEIEDKRIGLSPLEKSTRYVSFAQKRPDGEYQYIVPGEIMDTKLETEYKKGMDLLFGTYVDLLEPYLEYIKKLYPMGEDETERSFLGSRSAKRFDDLRDLLPYSTQTNVALFGNGRAYEDLVNRLLGHPLGENRYWGQMMLNEFEKVVPSFVRRPKTERGAGVQLYRKNIMALRDEMYSKVLKKEKYSRHPAKSWVRLISSTPDADVSILASYLFSGGIGASFRDTERSISRLSQKQRDEFLGKILLERKFKKIAIERPEVRFRKVPRAFENAHYLFEVWARCGDYKDLQRHRQQTQDRQRFSTLWGYDIEKELGESPFKKRVEEALKATQKLYPKLLKVSPYVAQYCVAFSYITHWYMHLSAREIYWIGELRTSPQGRSHYRKICQQIATLAKAKDPAIFQGMMVDYNDYSMARRESEKKIEQKLQGLK